MEKLKPPFAYSTAELVEELLQGVADGRYIPPELVYAWIEGLDAQGKNDQEKLTEATKMLSGIYMLASIIMCKHPIVDRWPETELRSSLNLAAGIRALELSTDRDDVELGLLSKSSLGISPRQAVKEETLLRRFRQKLVLRVASPSPGLRK